MSVRRLLSGKWTKERLGPMALQAAPWVVLAAMAAFWPRKRGEPKPGLSVQVHAEPESFDVAATSWPAPRGPRAPHGR